jgi:hypothetical protein
VTVATNGRANAVLICALCPPPLVAVRVAAVPAVLVSAKFTEVNPVDEATTLYGPPAVEFAPNVCEVATPLELVVSVSVVDGGVVSNRPLAPEAGAVKVTVTPLTGLPPLVTVATKGLANGVRIFALCPPPLVAVRISPVPAVLVSAKLTEVNPVDEATTLYGPPTVAFAVKIFEVAWPFEPVTSVSVAAGGVVANVPLAPEAGAVKVTETPLTGLL